MNSPSLVSQKERPRGPAGRVSLETAMSLTFRKEGVFEMKGLQVRGPPHMTPV